MTETEWAEAFASHLTRLGARTSQDEALKLGLELFQLMGELEPEDVAESEMNSGSFGP